MSSYTLPVRPSIQPDGSLHTRPNVFSMGVKYLAVVGTSNGTNFHFRISFVGVSDQGLSESIRLDPRPVLIHPDPASLGFPSSMHAYVIVEYKAYSYSKRPGPEPFIYNVPPGTTVGQVLNVVFNICGLDRYIFNPNGHGCRHWCATVLDKLAEARIIHESVPRLFLDAELDAHEGLGNTAYPWPRPQGRFY